MRTKLFKVNEQWKIIFCDTYEGIRENLLEVSILLISVATSFRSKAVYADFVEPKEQSKSNYQSQQKPPSTQQLKQSQWWEVLGVSRNAAIDDISKAYREQSRKHHPVGMSSVERDRRTEKMKEINIAYQSAKQYARV